MATYRDIVNIASKRNILIEDDCESQCYRASCPEGMRYEPGLHEVIAVYSNGIIGNGKTKAEARTDLFERLTEDVPTCEPCTDLNCDWCLTFSR